MFKVGEKLKCVNNLSREVSLKLGGVYTIKAINSSGKAVKLKEYQAGRISLRADRFVSVERERGFDPAEVPSKEEWDRRQQAKATARNPSGVKGQGTGSTAGRSPHPMSGIARAVGAMDRSSRIEVAFRMGTTGARG